MKFIQKIKNYFYINESYEFRRKTTKYLKKVIGWRAKSFCASNTSYGWYNFTLSKGDITDYIDFINFLKPFQKYINEYFNRSNNHIFIEERYDEGFWKGTWLFYSNIYTPLGLLLVSKYDKDNLVRMQFLTSDCYVKDWRERCERNHS